MRTFEPMQRPSETGDHAESSQETRPAPERRSPENEVVKW